MPRILVVALILLAAACRGTDTIRPTWSADTGIYGTSEHFGPASFICGVGYDLRYRGGVPLAQVDVAVRFPAAFLVLAAGQSSVKDDWNRAVLGSVNGHDLALEAARAGHASGTVGGICPNGPPDLASLRGTVVRVTWRDGDGEHTQDFAVDRVRTLVRQWGGEASTDWQVRLDWSP